MDLGGEPQEGRLTQKIKENPFFPIGGHWTNNVVSPMVWDCRLFGLFFGLGIFGLLTACGIGAYKYKDRGSMSTSVYLMQLRVTAQSAVIGTLAFGLAYHMVRRHLLKIE